MLKRKDVMLAYPVTEHRINNLGGKFLIQPKFRGERCWVEWFHGEPVLLSSYGNEFKFLYHIKNDLVKLPQINYDGELYRHDWNQGRINSAANRKVNKNEDSKELKLIIFDTKENFHQYDRLENLDIILNSFKHSEINSIRMATTLVTQKEHWMKCAINYVNQGYEGAILRNFLGKYVPKRSIRLLKFKPTEIDEYEIIYVNEAISNEGEAKGMIGSFTVKATDDIIFDVGAGKLTHEKRVKYWWIRDEIIGRTLITKHEIEFTDKGIPMCVVAVDIK